MSRSKSLSIDAAMQKLHNAAKAVRQRKGVKPHVQRRVEEALILLANGSTPEPMGARSESTYLNFLRSVHMDAGLSMVALCAIGLGKSAIGFLKDSIYLELPAMIHEQVAVLDSESLQRLVEGYPTKCEVELLLTQRLVANSLHRFTESCS